MTRGIWASGIKCFSPKKCSGKFVSRAILNLYGSFLFGFLTHLKEEVGTGLRLWGGAHKTFLNTQIP